VRKISFEQHFTTVNLRGVESWAET